MDVTCAVAWSDSSMVNICVDSLCGFCVIVFHLLPTTTLSVSDSALVGYSRLSVCPQHNSK